MTATNAADPGAHAFHGGAFFDAIGVDFRHLARRADVVSADVLDAWYDPSPRVLDVLREHLAFALRTSPPTHGAGLIEAIAAARDLRPANLLLGGGTSNLMYLTLPRLIARGSRVLLLDPTYGEYPHLLEHVLGAHVTRFDLEPRDGFEVDPQRLAAAARDVDLVVIVDPNSPTGRPMEPAAWDTLLDALAPDQRVWVDETYGDFVPGRVPVERRVADDPRVIVAKSMSKYYALSGVRVGYLVAAQQLVRELASASPPWSVGLVAQIAATEALRDPEWYAARAAETAALRDELRAGIDRIGGLRCFPSSANFLLFATADVPAHQIVARCRDAGVFLRDCSSLSSRLAGRLVRTAVKDRAGNARILAALEHALG